MPPKQTEKAKATPKDEKDYALPTPLQQLEKQAAGSKTSTPVGPKTRTQDVKPKTASSTSEALDESMIDQEISETEKSIRETEAQIEKLEKQARLKEKQNQLAKMKAKLERKEQKLKAATEKGETETISHKTDSDVTAADIRKDKKLKKKAVKKMINLGLYSDENDSSDSACSSSSKLSEVSDQSDSGKKSKKQSKSLTGTLSLNTTQHNQSPKVIQEEQSIVILIFLLNLIHHYLQVARVQNLTTRKNLKRNQKNLGCQKRLLTKLRILRFGRTRFYNMSLYLSICHSKNYLKLCFSVVNSKFLHLGFQNLSLKAEFCF